MSLRDQLRAARPLLLPALVTVMGWVAVVGTLGPAGTFPTLPEGPGLTLDEPFNVQQGVYLVEAVRAYGLGLLHPDSLQEVFGNPAYLPDHPPMGRAWIGLFHHATGRFLPAGEPATELPDVFARARIASATAYALCVLAVGAAAAFWYGRAAGVAAAVSMLLMPRLFAHAHLASLETVLNLTYVLAVLCVAGVWSRTPAPAARQAAWTGAVFGAALLTKIQAILLPVPIAVWAVWHWRGRALKPLLVWGLTGLAVFFLGWPWLWLDPVDHLTEYLGRTTERVTLYTWYFGTRYADTAVPWHYPFVMFLATVPVGLHALGIAGLFSGDEPAWKGRREQCLLACLLFPLLVFAVPGVPVYDGARLFLMVFPLWAVFAGRGGAFVLDRLCRKFSSAWAIGLLSVFLALQSYGTIFLHPCQLSYYNLLTGGLRGAERLGLEPTYWGDSVTRSLLRRTVETVPRGATVHVSPVLHQMQLETLRDQSPLLRRHDVTLEPFDPSVTTDAEYLLLFRRKADLPPPLRESPPDRLLAAVRREGVLLAGLYELR